MATEYQYMAMPFIGVIKANKESAFDVASQLENVINSQAQSGWEFVEVADVDIEVKPGCLGGMFGSGSSYKRLNQIIFRREVDWG